MNGGGLLRYVSFSLYGAFQIMLYLSSSLTHLFTDYPKIHSPLRVIDQASVYLLIAGTYTPIALIALPDPWRWTVFGVVWGLALAGILMKTVFLRGKNIVSDLLYLPMGWLIIAAFKPLKASSPPGLIMWTKSCPLASVCSGRGNQLLSRVRLLSHLNNHCSRISPAGRPPFTSSRCFPVSEPLW